MRARYANTALDHGDRLSFNKLSLLKEWPMSTPFLTAGSEGTLEPTEGQQPAQMAAAKKIAGSGNSLRCSTRAVVPLKSTKVYTSQCAAIIGMNPNTTITYTVTRDQHSNGFISWVPWAFTKKRVSVVKPPLKPTYFWRYTGAWNKLGGANDMSVRVPWGEVAAVPKVKFTNGAYIGWAGTFKAG